MKKIFVYIGSRSGEKSTTLQYINNVLNKVTESVGKDNVEVDLYITTSCKINNCLGCNACFYTGKCHQDNKDDMKLIKSKMLNSDFVIFASPVYMHNVSGDMKIFIDRISYWTHLIKLAGKVGVAIATSSGNGLEITTNYIHKVMAYLGIKVVGEFGVVSYVEDEKYEAQIDRCSNIIIEYLNGKKVESDRALDLVFEANKVAVKSQSEYNTSEYRYWKDHGLLNCNNFKEVLEMIENKEKCYLTIDNAL